MNFRRILGLVGSACVGAGIMYFADPRMGRRRRSLLKDQAVGVDKKVRRFVSGRSEDVKNRAYGVYCEVRSLIGVPCEGERRHA
jgi:hypothetical protein